jgi:hypothetical protein
MNSKERELSVFYLVLFVPQKFRNYANNLSHLLVAEGFCFMELYLAFPSIISRIKIKTVCKNKTFETITEINFLLLLLFLDLVFGENDKIQKI